MGASNDMRAGNEVVIEVRRPDHDPAGAGQQSQSSER
jgi:hypothetical protein